MEATAHLCSSVSTLSASTSIDFPVHFVACQKATTQKTPSSTQTFPDPPIGERLMGGQNVSCDFGGGKRTIERALQNQSWKPQEVGFARSVPVSSKKTTGRKQRGAGGKSIIGGGVQNRCLEGVLWYVFPSPEFSTGIVLSGLRGATQMFGRVFRIFFAFFKPFFVSLLKVFRGNFVLQACRPNFFGKEQGKPAK